MNGDNYDDIIDLPHPVSPTRVHMPVADRAAQFAPFAALTGYGEAVKETARQTDEKREPDEAAKTELNEKLRYLQDNSKDMPVASFTYFVPDESKSGGAYVTKTGTLKKVDVYKQTIMLSDGTVFPVSCLYHIDGEMFPTEGWF